MEEQFHYLMMGLNPLEPNELNTMGHETKNHVIFQMQDRLDKLEHDYENLTEQIRLAGHSKGFLKL